MNVSNLQGSDGVGIEIIMGVKEALGYFLP